MKAVLTKVDSVDYHYVQVQGYANRGKVKRLLSQGWEIVNYTPIILGGITIKQGIYALRRRVTT